MVDRVVVINDMSVAQGGATVLALRSAELLRERGLPVTFFTGEGGGEGRLEAMGARVVGCGGNTLLASPPAVAAVNGIHNTKARAALAALVAEADTPGTVYHVHGWSQVLSPAIFDALRPVAPRCVIHAHDFFMACPNGAFMDYNHQIECFRKPLSLSCVTTHCDKRSYGQKVWRVARQANLVRAFDRRLPWARLVMLHPGMAPLLRLAGIPERMLVTVRNPAQPYTTERVRAEENRRFLFVGRVEAEKGIEECILATRSAGVPLTVAGDGSLLPKLRETYPEVEFLGWSDRAAIGRAAARSRALIMPSSYPEPFGLVAVEALQSGLPVLASDTALLAAEIVDYGLGVACRARDPAAFSRAVTMLRDLPPGEVAAMSLRAYRPARPLATSDEEWAEQLLGLYDHVLAEASATRARRAS